MKFLLLATLLLHLPGPVTADNPDAVIGIWKNGSGKGHIQIYKQGGRYFGKIVWLKDARDEQGQLKADRKNPAAAQRTQPLIGLVMMKDFRYASGEWSGGRIYNPSYGKEYKAYMRMKDNNTLSVRGYVGFSWIGKTDVWTRVQ